MKQLSRMSRMSRMSVTLTRLAAGDSGQDLLEYGLLAALIAVVAIAGVTVLGSTIYENFWKVIGTAV